jgi:hypothetical protein
MFTSSGRMVRLRTVASLQNLIPSERATGMLPLPYGSDGPQALDDTPTVRNPPTTTRRYGDAVFAYRYLFPGRHVFAPDDTAGGPAELGQIMYLAFGRHKENATEFTPIGSQPARY